MQSPTLKTKAIERIVASKGAYLPKTHKDTVLSMSISDEDTDAGSDFIELQPVDKYKENKENIELGIDLTPNVDDSWYYLMEFCGSQYQYHLHHRQDVVEDNQWLHWNFRHLQVALTPLHLHLPLHLLHIDDRIWKFAHSLDRNDKSLWNKTDGSPKIKVFKEHFGDEFNMKSVELKEFFSLLFSSCAWKSSIFSLLFVSPSSSSSSSV
jgi:hypothetical protein